MPPHRPPGMRSPSSPAPAGKKRVSRNGSSITNRSASVTSIFIPTTTTRSRCSAPSRRTPIGIDPFVTFMHWPGAGQQVEIYLHFLKTFKHETAWFSFLDIDEFFVLKGVDNIARFMRDYESQVDCLYFNWVVYGNSGKIRREDGPTLTSYLRREATPDGHTKMLCRSAAIDAGAVERGMPWGVGRSIISSTITSCRGFGAATCCWGRPMVTRPVSVRARNLSFSVTGSPRRCCSVPTSPISSSARRRISSGAGAVAALRRMKCGAGCSKRGRTGRSWRRATGFTTRIWPRTGIATRRMRCASGCPHRVAGRWARMWR